MEKYGFDATGSRILVVEDDPDTQSLLVECLVPPYRVVTTMTGEEAFDACRQVRFDLAVVDVRLPDTTGIDLVPRFQCVNPAMPIILMTAFPRTQDAFWAGDSRGIVGYVEKPFSPWELRRRVEKALAAAGEGQPLQLGDLTIDCVARQVLRDGRRLSLTQQEVDILVCIARAGRKGEIIRYEELIQEVWDCESSAADTASVRVTISRLRQKLNDDLDKPRYIETVRGVGYRAVPEGGRDQM